MCTKISCTLEMFRPAKLPAALQCSLQHSSYGLRAVLQWTMTHMCKRCRALISGVHRLAQPELQHADIKEVLQCKTTIFFSISCVYLSLWFLNVGCQPGGFFFLFWRQQFKLKPVPMPKGQYAILQFSPLNSAPFGYLFTLLWGVWPLKSQKLQEYNFF